ncbi:MAG: hypothetical protein JNJ54_09810 [Myxococcaceae bacterium]|nr:hypothetical protein [Myxococcaceae bacterium]
MAVHEYRPAAPKKPARQRFPVPWGLFVVLAIYACAVVGYIWKTYWESPEYQAAEHYATALSLLGVDDGRKCSEADLVAAFGHVLEAARLIPENKHLATHTERLRWRFDERGFKLSPDFVRKAELVSKAAQRVEEERSPWLAVGSRDRGWAPDQLLAAPERVVWWSSPGVVLIIAVWAYGQFGSKRAREREHEANLRKEEAAVEKLGAWREGLGTAPRKYDAAQEDDEGDATLAEPPLPKPRTSSSGRARASSNSPGRPAVSPGERSTASSSSPGRAASKSSPGRPAVKSSPGRPAVKSSGGRPAVKRSDEGDPDA